MKFLWEAMSACLVVSLAAVLLSAAEAQPVAQWFVNAVNHFNPQDTRTYRQRFYVNETYFSGSGPIFFQVRAPPPSRARLSANDDDEHSPPPGGAHSSAARRQ